MISTLALLTPHFMANADNRSERTRLNTVVVAYAFLIAARPAHLTRRTKEIVIYFYASQILSSCSVEII